MLVFNPISITDFISPKQVGPLSRQSGSPAGGTATTPAGGSDPEGFAWNVASQGDGLADAVLPYKWDIGIAHGALGDGADAIGKWVNSPALDDEVRYYSTAGIDGKACIRIQPATSSGDGQCYAGVSGPSLANLTQLSIAMAMKLKPGLADKMSNNDKFIEVQNTSTGERYFAMLHPHATNAVDFNLALDGGDSGHTWADFTPALAWGSNGVGDNYLWCCYTVDRITNYSRWTIWDRNGTWSQDQLTNTTQVMTSGSFTLINVVGGFWNAVVPTLVDGTDYLELGDIYIAETDLIPPPSWFVL